MVKLRQQFGFRWVYFLPWYKALALILFWGCGVTPAIVWAHNDDLSVVEERPVMPPEPTEFIAAWISDLKQSNERWIQVDLSEQRLTAWEGDTPMFSATGSTGREGDWTPPGVYAVETKYEKTRMQGDDYDIPDVPYVMYFFGSYAIHGVYWHTDFGTPVSRGCVGLEVDQAAWLFSWATEGTRVVIQR